MQKWNTKEDSGTIISDLIKLTIVGEGGRGYGINTVEGWITLFQPCSIADETDLLVKLKDGWMNWKRKDEGKRGRGL